MDSNFIKVFAGNSFEAQRITLALKESKINPIVKDESESARLAGFGALVPKLVEIYVNKDEEENALAIITKLNS
ncbi:putative signal transducing protein [Maribacter ulvicola]|uniref:Putative signal transducing protein n=1 Tax=Maribacter ulvicola TaxID=228959 RepID=A0A1N6XKC6_9FLAO|nr:DUF2007 domain-containing protein [Maribacter ulvicola]SIR02782.1 Putative signal transducing protein [Maribacter ulvicola]